VSAMDADFAPGLPAMEAIAASELAPEADPETHGVPKGPGQISKGAYFPGPLGEPKGSPMSPLPPISPPFEIRGFQLRRFFGRVFFAPWFQYTAEAN
jgi:hypothetical protein